MSRSSVSTERRKYTCDRAANLPREPRVRGALLEALLAGGHEIALVVTQPDRPAGRGQTPRRHPWRRTPATTGCRCGRRRRCAATRPRSVCAASTRTRWRWPRSPRWSRRTCSRWRPRHLERASVAAAALARRRADPGALLAGDAETGVSIIRLVEALDAGPILLQERVPIAPEDDYLTLEPRLAALGARLLVRALARAADARAAGRQRSHVLPAHRARGRAHRLDAARPRRSGTRCAPIAAGRRRSRRSTARSSRCCAPWPRTGRAAEPGDGRADARRATGSRGRPLAAPGRGSARRQAGDAAAPSLLRGYPQLMARTKLA